MDKEIIDIFTNDLVKVVIINKDKVTTRDKLLEHDETKELLDNGCVIYSRTRYLTYKNDLQHNDKLILAISNGSTNVYNTNVNRFIDMDTGVSRYKKITLKSNGSNMEYNLNRLVLSTFSLDKANEILLTEDIVEGDHKDSNKRNDLFNNLRWVTVKENINYARKYNPNFRDNIAVRIDSKVYHDRNSAYEALSKLTNKTIGSILATVETNLRVGESTNYMGYLVEVLDNQHYADYILKLHPDYKQLKEPYDNFAITPDGVLFSFIKGIILSKRERHNIPYYVTTVSPKDNPSRREHLILERLVAEYFLDWNGVDRIINISGDRSDTSVSNLKVVKLSDSTDPEFGEVKVLDENPDYGISEHGYIVNINTNRKMAILTNEKNTGFTFSEIKMSSNDTIKLYMRKLILKYFHNKDPDKHIIIHKDGDGKNNKKDNISYKKDLIFDIDMFKGTVRWYGVKDDKIYILDHTKPIEYFISKYSYIYGKYILHDTDIIVTTNGIVYRTDKPLNKVNKRVVFDLATSTDRRGRVQIKRDGIAKEIRIKTLLHKVFDLK